MLPLETQFLAFLIHLHDSIAPHSWGAMFATPFETLEGYFDTILVVFDEVVVPRLFFFEDAHAVRARLPPEKLKNHPDILLAADGTLFPFKTPQTFLLNKLMYNNYKDSHGAHVLLGTFL